MWRHQQSIMTSSAERKPSDWDTGTACKDRHFLSSFMDSLCRVRNKIMYVLSWRTVSALTRDLFGVYFPLCFATREMNTKITLSWALPETVPHSGTYIILYSVVHQEYEIGIYHAGLWFLNQYNGRSVAYANNCSQWHHNATTIASMTLMWGTHWGALRDHWVALLMLSNSGNPHDINW